MSLFSRWTRRLARSPRPSAPRAATAPGAGAGRPHALASLCCPGDHLADLWQLAPDGLLQLALDAMRVLETGLAVDLGHDVRVDPSVPVAELDVDETLDLGV